MKNLHLSAMLVAVSASVLPVVLAASAPAQPNPPAILVLQTNVPRTQSNYIYRLNGLNVVYGPPIPEVQTMSPTFGDFSGNGVTDIFWRDESFFLFRWRITQMSGNTILSISDINSGFAGWDLRLVGDFNGDGKDDILWTNGAQAGIWLMSLVPWQQVGRTFTAGANWIPKVAADFNGDGIDDIGWENKVTGKVGVWIMNSEGRWSTGNIFDLPNGYELAYAGNVNGAGNADLIFRLENNSGAAVWLMDGTEVIGSMELATPNTILEGVGDVNGDGKTDILCRIAANNGTLFAYQNIATGTTFSPETKIYGWNLEDWQIISIMDINQDGIDDIIWRNYVYRMMAFWQNGTNGPVGSLVWHAIAPYIRIWTPGRQ
jgi:hypothetical protein